MKLTVKIKDDTAVFTTPEGKKITISRDDDPYEAVEWVFKELGFEIEDE